MKNERDLPPAIDAATRFSIRPAPVSALSTFLKRDSLLSSFPPFFRDSSGTKGRGEEKKGRGYFPRTFSFGPVNLDHPPFNPLPVPKLVLRLRSRIKDFLYKRARAHRPTSRNSQSRTLSLASPSAHTSSILFLFPFLFPVCVSRSDRACIRVVQACESVEARLRPKFPTNVRNVSERGWLRSPLAVWRLLPSLPHVPCRKFTRWKSISYFTADRARYS